MRSPAFFIGVLLIAQGRAEQCSDSQDCTIDSDDEVLDLSVQMLQHSADLRTPRPCTTYAPGIHLIQMPEIRRQFLLSVPDELAPHPNGVPLVMVFHGYGDSPWYANRNGGYSNLLNRYGWLGIFPFGLNATYDNGMDGVNACCPEGCRDECCRRGSQMIQGNSGSSCSYFGDNTSYVHELHYLFVRRLVRWARGNTCVDASNIFGLGFSNGGFMARELMCHMNSDFRALASMSGGHNDGRSCTASLRATSYIDMCGTLDSCDTQRASGDTHAFLNNCTDNWAETRMSATTVCARRTACAGGSFVELCQIEGLGHEFSGHIRPDETSVLRPFADIDFVEHAFQKFSITVNGSMLFYGHPTVEDLQHAAAYLTFHDHQDFRDRMMEETQPFRGSATTVPVLASSLIVLLYIAF